MQNWCPFAVKKPLGAQTQRVIGKPRIFLIHTMSGYLRGTDSMFREGGYSGTESHFGIGGEYDPPDLDGAIWQWTPLERSADAQFDGNAYATSVETSDGTHSRGWNPKQMDAIIRLGVWWCQQTGNPARIVESPDQAGFGWHAQFNIWNRNAHNCPGAARVSQYKNRIVPEIARRLKEGDDMQPGDSVPVGKTYDGDFAQEHYPASFIWVGAMAEAKRAGAAARAAGAKTDQLEVKIDKLTELVQAFIEMPKTP